MARTAPYGDDGSHSFLSPALSADEMGRLGPYRVLRVLGSGGMGVVFEAEDTQLLRHVALKVMKPGVAANISARKRFLREARTAASVEHDHIVPIYQVGEEHGVPFIAMPLLRGQTLAERLEQCSRHSADGADNPKSKIQNPKSLPTPELVRIGHELALGLAAAHRRGLIHRDIKPSNIWLEEETGRVKLLDFGLAREGDDGEQLTHSGSLLGTPAYMSPEQAGGGVADARSDLFSLGCVLYHAATGRRPFVGRDTLSTLLAVTTTEPPAPHELNRALPGDLSDLIVALLTKDPAGRPQTAREVAERLAAVGNRLRTVPPVVAQASSLVAEAGLAALTAAHQPSVGSGAPSGSGAVPQALESTLDGESRNASEGVPERAAPPRWRIGLVCAAAAAALLAGVVIVIKDREGKVVATVQTADRADVTFDPEYTAEIKPTPAVPDINPERQRGEPRADALSHDAPSTRAEIEATKTQDLRPKTSPPNPKSKIENPKSPDAPPPAIAPFDEDQARQQQQAWADHLGIPLEHTNSIGMKFILIPPGEFTMGSTQAEIEQALKDAGEDKHWQEFIRSEAPQHKVVLTRPFYLSVHEVTQKEYEAVMGVNPSNFAKTNPDEKVVKQLTELDTANHPVEQVSWNDAAEFCAKLSKQEELKPFYFRAAERVTGLKGTGYRLPTEAEWEFACRAGTTTKFWIGDKEQELVGAGWFGGISGGRTHEVEELASNPFGLFDVHGNVWEWVEDSWEPMFYERVAAKSAIDPKSPFSAGAQRVIRGGNWGDDASYCRSADRLADDPTSRGNNIGFRVVLVAASLRARR